MIALTMCCAVLAAMMLLQGRETGRVYRFTASGRALPEVERIALPQGSVDVNGGDAQELMRLPGIGSVWAQAIMDERVNGRFYYPEDLLAVRGIGEKTLEKFRNMLKMAEGE